MRVIEVGYVLPVLEDPPTGDKPTWSQIRQLSSLAEELELDALWIPDELLWKVPDWPGPRGFWECVALTGAVAASTTKIKIGTWVLSALHRNPALTAKIAATLDEIAGGRFIFGLGAGHSGGQGRSFGFPQSHTVSRYEEALEIIVPALRGDEVTFDGVYHSARELVNRPLGPGGTAITLMLAGHGPRTMASAVRHADIWSAYSTDDSRPAAFTERLDRLRVECEKQGRDPASLKKSVGVILEPPDSPVRSEDVGLGIPLRGNVADLTEQFLEFADMGVDSLEVTSFPEGERRGLEFLGEVTVGLGGTN